jgi:hypothetical protein
VLALLLPVFGSRPGRLMCQSMRNSGAVHELAQAFIASPGDRGGRIREQLWVQMIRAWSRSQSVRPGPGNVNVVTNTVWPSPPH